MPLLFDTTRFQSQPAPYTAARSGPLPNGQPNPPPFYTRLCAPTQKFTSTSEIKHIGVLARLGCHNLSHLSAALIDALHHQNREQYLKAKLKIEMRFIKDPVLRQRRWKLIQKETLEQRRRDVESSAVTGGMHMDSD
ncbi:hypothetical protein M422DRAFT_776143 [Sphaerobolus stellatus SS14]|nr:hypothetical protein M422DRAFT_776143 [Sphaerobolus stellatus SS14]